MPTQNRAVITNGTTNLSIIALTRG
jgi:hypothetical protein